MSSDILKRPLIFYLVCKTAQFREIMYIVIYSSFCTLQNTQSQFSYGIREEFVGNYNWCKVKGHIANFYRAWFILEWKFAKYIEENTYLKVHPLFTYKNHNSLIYPLLMIQFFLFSWNVRLLFCSSKECT